jgi:hypothetical protein
MELGLGMVLSLLIVGFLLGYGVRAGISRRRRAVARRHRLS